MEPLKIMTLVMLLISGTCGCNQKKMKILPDPPRFERVLPKDIANEVKITDAELQKYFPGQFYTEDDIKEIDLIEKAVTHTERTRRDTDYDLCCPTRVWFGSAPMNMTDIEGDTYSIVCGDQIQQAFSRGDCLQIEPRDSCKVSNGVCRQKTRLVWLWVEKEPGSRDYLYKYFKVHSHCAYEHIGKDRPVLQ